MNRHVLSGIAAALVLAACGKPEAPDKEQPPEPQAVQADARDDAPAEAAGG